MKRNFKIKTSTLVFMAFLFLTVLGFMVSPEIGGLGAVSMAALVPVWGIVKEGTFKELSVDEIAKLSDDEQVQYFAAKADHQKTQMTAEFKKMIDEAKKGTIDEETLKSKLDDFAKKLAEAENEELKGLKDAVKKNQEIIKDYNEKLKTQGSALRKLQDQGIIGPDNQVNKDVLRTIVTKHLEEAGLIGEEEVNEHGLKVKPIKLKSNEKISDSSTDQVIDVRTLSHKHAAQKAGEAVFVGGTGTQAVFNQAINRTGMGSISDPLTANAHALDIFSVKNITGSLMTLLVYENLEANGELVAEGAAPSADSRIELNSKDFKVFDFSATASISKNLLRDSGEVIDELVKQLASNIKTVLDDALFTDAGDNSATPWGVFNTDHSCENFNPLLFTGTSPKANIISVIGKAKLQARLNNWMVDSTILNPFQDDEIEDLKDADENSIRDNRLAVDSLGNVVGVKGMRKHQTTKMPQNALCVFNSGLQEIGLRQDIETQFGHSNDDIKKRRVTFVMDMRGAYAQKAKKSSIYVTNITDAIAILKESAAASLTRIQAYATGSDASELTVATLVNAGVENVNAANLAEYKATIAGESSIANLAALQTLIDTDNAD